jgi:hypothetical protein
MMNAATRPPISRTIPADRGRDERRVEQVHDRRAGRGDGVPCGLCRGEHTLRSGSAHQLLPHALQGRDEERRHAASDVRPRLTQPDQLVRQACAGIGECFEAALDAVEHVMEAHELALGAVRRLGEGVEPAAGVGHPFDDESTLSAICLDAVPTLSNASVSFDSSPARVRVT